MGSTLATITKQFRLRLVTKTVFGAILRHHLPVVAKLVLSAGEFLDVEKRLSLGVIPIFRGNINQIEYRPLEMESEFIISQIIGGGIHVTLDIVLVELPSGSRVLPKIPYSRAAVRE